jgi:XTP/dITP diphosphohydrolase
MKKLVIATQNRNKFKEMKEALQGVPWEILPAFDFPGTPDVAEDGKTLEENSLKKAREVSCFTGLPSLADDTGLFVEALGGQPGIYAARFAGANCTYEDNVKKLLRLLESKPDDCRNACFKTVITLFYPGNSFEQVIGEVEGSIVYEPRGNGGFGYDPIFLPSGYSKVFAEMALEEKNKISHRGKAVQKVRELLENKKGT